MIVLGDNDGLCLESISCHREHEVADTRMIIIIKIHFQLTIYLM